MSHMLCFAFCGHVPNTGYIVILQMCFDTRWSLHALTQWRNHSKSSKTGYYFLKETFIGTYKRPSIHYNFVCSLCKKEPQRFSEKWIGSTCFIVLFICFQVLALFPSSQGLEVTWSSVVKIGQSLYREGPGKDPFRPDQKTPVKNFFLAGSYTKQVT